VTIVAPWASDPIESAARTAASPTHATAAGRRDDDPVMSIGPTGLVASLKVHT
jgi:hypothetical protein